jgi:hypothetical protein
MMKLYKIEHRIQDNVMNCKTWSDLQEFLENYLELIKMR